MSVTLHWGTYNHEEGTASIAIDRVTILDEEGEEKRGLGNRWTITGTLIGDGTSPLVVKKDLLDTAYASGGKDFLVKEDGNTIISLLTADCKGGTRVASGPNYPDTRAGVLVTKLPFTIVIEGDVFDGEDVDDEIIELEEHWVYNIAQDEHTTRTVRGRLKVKDGISAYTKVQTRDPRTAGEEVRIPAVPLITDYQRMSYSIDTNQNDDDATFSFVDWEFWKALPASTSAGGYTTRKSITDNDSHILTVSGSFTGTGAQVAADAVLAAITVDAANDIIREEQTIDEYKGTVSFTYEYNDTAASEDIISWEETVSVQPSGTLKIVRPILNPAATPITQEICEIPSRANQSGSAVGMNAWPDFPDYSFDSDYFNPMASSQSRTGPEKGPNGDYFNYKISWTNVFDIPVQTDVPNPHVL